MGMGGERRKFLRHVLMPAGWTDQRVDIRVPANQLLEACAALPALVLEDRHGYWVALLRISNAIVSTSLLTSAGGAVWWLEMIENATMRLGSSPA